MSATDTTDMQPETLTLRELLGGLPRWMLALTVLMSLSSMLYWGLGPARTLDTLDLVFGLTHPARATGEALVPPTEAFRTSYVVHPVRIALHYVGMPLMLLAGALQFSAPLRRRRPRVHRWIGRMFFASLAVGLLGVGIKLATGDVYGGRLSVYQFTGMAAMTLMCASMGLVSALRRRFAEHERWMWRTYCVVWSSAVVSRLLILLWVPVAWASMGGRPEDYPIPYNAALFVSWAFPVVIADAAWDLRRRRRARPA